MAKSQAYRGLSLPEAKRQKCGHVAYIKKGRACQQCRSMFWPESVDFVSLRSVEVAPNFPQRFRRAVEMRAQREHTTLGPY